MLAAAQIIGDEALLSLALKTAGVTAENRSQALERSRVAGDNAIAQCREGPLAMLADKPNPLFAGNQRPFRYSATVGSKDPCPCGSGKKYKRCCMEKDRAGRLPALEVHDPKTLRHNLSVKEISRLSEPELAQVDPARLQSDAREEYFANLCVYLMWDVAAAALEKLGFRPELENSWNRVLQLAAREGKRDIVERVVAVRSAVEEVEIKSLPVVARLLLLKDEPDTFLDTADSMAYWTLKLGEDRHLFDFAAGILHSTRLTAVGIHVARSLIPLLPREQAVFLYDEILRVRDAIGLPPDDEYADILEKRFTEGIPAHGKDTTALREAQQRLEAKASEVRQLRSRLDHLNHEVGRLEAARHAVEATRTAVSAEKPASVPADESVLRDLRRKVEEMKALLQERNKERGHLRRELGAAHEALEKSRNSTASLSAEHETENEHLSPEESFSTQPVRVPVYPRRFYETLHLLPPATARHALTAIARLAGGEPDAFKGVLRLKALTDIYRLRISIDHRLLFRLHSETIEIVDLINRRDLERRIKSLLAGG